jgi:hypothetical protein
MFFINDTSKPTFPTLIPEPRVIRQHPPTYVNSKTPKEEYQRDKDEIFEEHYNFGSYDLFHRKRNHEYNKHAEELERLPRIVRLNSPENMMLPWMPLNSGDGDVVQQNWWIQTNDPSNDTLITYGQMRKHKVKQ